MAPRAVLSIQTSSDGSPLIRDPLCGANDWMRNLVKTKFLVVYDYGQGGIWAFVIAEAIGEVKTRYPELEVIERRPDWMTSEIEIGLDTYDLEDAPTGLLRDLLKQRRLA